MGPSIQIRRRRGVLSFVGLTCGMLLGLAVNSPQAFAVSWANGIEAPLPANAASNPGSELTSISCGSAGNCSAVGNYVDGSSQEQGLLLTETSGVWATGVEPTPPANALSGHSGVPDSVSCVSAGNCTAVGQYTDSGQMEQALLLTESGGIWATGTEAALPANAVNGGFLSSVSCASAGNCSAVGQYHDTPSGLQGLLLTETNGTWGTGVEATLPAGAASAPGVQIWSVSCASAGNCSAVGLYHDSSGNQQGLLLTETNGIWGTGVEAALPAGAASNPSVILTSVSCASAGDCGAVGEYAEGSSAFANQGLLLTETNGVWGTGVEPTPPANAQPGYSGIANSVSCTSAGDCTAVGNYLDSGGEGQGLLLTQTGGTWATGVEAPVPANASTTDPNVILSSLSCVSAGNCGAVGRYYDDSGDPSGYNTQGLLLTESSGVWSAAQASLPPNAAPAPLANVGSVSCTAADSCSAVGAYDDSSGRTWGLLLGGSGGERTLNASTTGSGSGTVTGSGISCPGTCSKQYPGGTTVTLTATPASGSTFAGWSGGGCAGTAACSVTLNQDESVAATFAPGPRYSLTVTKTGSGTGTVTSSPAGIDCGSRCTAPFAPGTKVTLVPTPAPGSMFAGWSGVCSPGRAEQPSAGGRGSGCHVTMDSARAATANFISTAQVASIRHWLKGGLAALHQALNSPSSVGKAECTGQVSYGAKDAHAGILTAAPITFAKAPGTQPAGAGRLSAHAVRRPIIVFAGARRRLLRPGTARITQRLTTQGRQLLMRAGRQHQTLTLGVRLSLTFNDPSIVGISQPILIKPPPPPRC